MTVPFGTHNLYISCCNDKQFDGIRKVFRELGSSPSSHYFLWRGTPLDLARRRVLRRVLVSGHGSPRKAGFELSTPRAFRPSDLRLPRGADLYLLGCYQGGEPQRLAWAAGTGIAPARVWGCAGETESALSTCLLLHLLEGGPESLDRWFAVWTDSNDAFRAYFPMIRRAYARSDADALTALSDLKSDGELDSLFREYADFIGVITRRPSLLTDLV